MGLIADLGPGPIALDTAVFTYFIEQSSQYGELLDTLFQAIACGDLTAVTSELTLLDVLVVPYRAGDLVLADRYEALLSRSRGLRLIPIDRQVLRSAAQLRARYRLRTPDAIHLASAMIGESQTFLTNDQGLRPVDGVSVLQLRDLST